MATYTSNFGWTKPSGSDNVDISVLNNNLDDQDSTIHDAFLNMAPPFSESSTYAVDDIVLYTTGLYKCHTAVVTPGSWTGSTNWQVYKLSEGGSGGGGTSNYNDLTNKPSINGVTLSGNKTTSDLSIDKTAVGLGNVPNVSTNDQTPTFTEASTRNNIASGEKLSVILGKVQKFFNDLKTVAFSGSFSDLSNKPENANTFQGTISEWNALTTAEKKAYDHASIPDSIDGGVTFPADKVIMTGGGDVEDAIDDLKTIGSVLYEYTASANETWSSALDHLYGHTGLNTAILMPNIGITFMPSVSNRFGTIYINSSGKLITAAIHLKQSGSMYRENAADSTTVSDLGLNAFTQGYKMQVIKLY